MTTEVRTFGEFLRHAAGSEAPLWTSDFNISEIARRALQRVMGTEHEDAHCIGYTETLFFRVFSCWFSAMWRAHSVDWINGVEGARDGYEAATRAASNAAVAVDKFGTNLSIARETAIRNWLVENKGVGLTSTAGKALLNTFAATFDDAIIQPLTGNMIVKVGDEEPRQLRSAGDTEERAHTFDAPADNAQVKVECRMIISADQSGDFLKLTLPEAPTGFSYVVKFFPLYKYVNVGYGTVGTTHGYEQSIGLIAAADTTGPEYVLTNAEITAVMRRTPPSNSISRAGYTFSGVVAEINSVADATESE